MIVRNQIDYDAWFQMQFTIFFCIIATRSHSHSYHVFASVERAERERRFSCSANPMIDGVNFAQNLAFFTRKIKNLQMFDFITLINYFTFSTINCAAIRRFGIHGACCHLFRSLLFSSGFLSLNVWFFVRFGDYREYLCFSFSRCSFELSQNNFFVINTKMNNLRPKSESPNFDTPTNHMQCFPLRVGVWKSKSKMWVNEPKSNWTFSLFSFTLHSLTLFALSVSVSVRCTIYNFIRNIIWCAASADFFSLGCFVLKIDHSRSNLNTTE